ncbi:MAG: macro domain-containing protein [Alphaproteobacteria bacterium]|nr:macro domain-containing protein [Alphaproteobacteria bacterium]
MTIHPYINHIRLVQGDIASQDVEAIVSLIPQDLEFSGRINERLMQASQANLDNFILENIYQPMVGDVYAVPGFALQARHIIFAVRPRWRDDWDREGKDLILCCRKAMVLAKCMLLGRIAFPPLASGKEGFPPERAARYLIAGILDRLDDRLKEIRIVVPDDALYKVYLDRLVSLRLEG